YVHGPAAGALAGGVVVEPRVPGGDLEAARAREGDDHQVGRARVARPQRGPAGVARGHEPGPRRGRGRALRRRARQLLGGGGARRARRRQAGEQDGEGEELPGHALRAYSAPRSGTVGLCRARSVAPTSSRETPASASSTPRWKSRSAASPLSSSGRACRAATTVSPASSTTFCATYPTPRSCRRAT